MKRREKHRFWRLSTAYGSSEVEIKSICSLIHPINAALQDVMKTDWVRSRSRLLHKRWWVGNPGDSSTWQYPHHPGPHPTLGRLVTGPPTVLAICCRVRAGLCCRLALDGAPGPWAVDGCTWEAEKLRHMIVLRVLAQSTWPSTNLQQTPGPPLQHVLLEVPPLSVVQWAKCPPSKLWTPGAPGEHVLSKSQAHTPCMHATPKKGGFHNRTYS